MPNKTKVIEKPRDYRSFFQKVIDFIVDTFTRWIARKETAAENGQQEADSIVESMQEEEKVEATHEKIDNESHVSIGDDNSITY